MEEDLNKIISNIKTIAWFLASKTDIDRNTELTNPDKPLISNIVDLKFSDLEYNLKKLNDYYKAKAMNTIMKVKLFVASSSKLADERNAIELYLARKNDEFIERGIYISYNVWEKQPLDFNHTYKQEDFNEALVYGSEIFICLIGDDVGRFTKEEFEKACKRFDQKPAVKPYLMYVYFKDAAAFGDLHVVESEGWARRLELKKVIEKEKGQVVGTYTNTDNLLRKIDAHILGDIEKVRQAKEGDPVK